MLNELRNIEALLESFLGKSKKGMGDDTQIQFNCPMCSIEKGLYDGDGKHNLEVNIQKNIFKCWVCGDTNEMSGKISKLIKMFGNETILQQYRAELYSIRQSKLYELKFNKTDFTDEDFYDDILISLPDGFKPITKNDYNAKNVLEYLYKRGINDKIIDKFNIGYIPKYNNNRFLRERVIVPSYDRYGILNYWIGRNYIENDWRYKYSNPDSDIIKKTNIVFNEEKINWYEDITLVEGVFDHIVVPNSIPLLGKTIGCDYSVFKTLLNNSRANINIFLDNDAIFNAKIVYKILNQGTLYNRIRLCLTPKDLDPSLIYQLYGVRGIRKILQNTIKLSDYELANLSFEKT